mmetsp:Transcript_42885/g.77050  ORF Transcript_42885/g.77050 Transcript_42885/m.77050 type:complete len:211 (+) Transcript_42885:847-1479(+)
MATTLRICRTSGDSYILSLLLTTRPLHTSSNHAMQSPSALGLMIPMTLSCETCCRCWSGWPGQKRCTPFWRSTARASRPGIGGVMSSSSSSSRRNGNLDLQWHWMGVRRRLLVVGLTTVQCDLLANTLYEMQGSYVSFHSEGAPPKATRHQAHNLQWKASKPLPSASSCCCACCLWIPACCRFHPHGLVAPAIPTHSLPYSLLSPSGSLW